MTNQSLAAFQDTMAAHEAAILSSSVSRQYLGGFRSSDGVLYVTKEEAILYLDSRYLEMAEQKQARGELPAGLVLRPAVFAKEFKALSEEGKTKRVLLEDRQVTAFQWKQWEKNYPCIEFVPLGDRVERMRMVKSREEIQKIRTAQALAEEAYAWILPRLERGRTEVEIAAELEFYMKKNGASGPSFETICVSGSRSSLPHGRAEAIPLSDGFVTMDFGCMLDGYASDMTRTVCIGKASVEMKTVYQTVLEAQQKAISAVRAGVTGAEVDRAARDHIAAAGYGDCFGHSTGHGIGLEVHEAPSFSPREERTIPDGAVLSVEPGIYLEGKFGVRIEDLVVVSEKGCENLNRSEKTLLEL